MAKAVIPSEARDLGRINAASRNRGPSLSLRMTFWEITPPMRLVHLAFQPAAGGLVLYSFAVYHYRNIATSWRSSSRSRTKSNKKL